MQEIINRYDTQGSPYMTLSPTEQLNAILKECQTAPVTTGVRMSELLKRPQVSYAALAPVDPERPQLPAAIFEQVETEIKYEGYIRRQQSQIAEMRRLEVQKLPQEPEFDYRTVTGLRLEAQEKLNRIRPLNIGQASRISGVSPADISVLLIRSKSRDLLQIPLPADSSAE